MKLKMAVALSVIVATQVANATGAEPNWTPRGSEQGVALFERAEPGQDFKSFRGIIRVKAPMKTVLALVLVRETFPRWVASVLEDRTLEANNDDASLCYLHIKGVWPTQDRDVVAKVSVEQDPQSLAVAVIARDTDPTLVPTYADRVRMPRFYSSFTVRPIGPNETEVQMDGIANPGGSVPAFAANMVAKDLPRDTLTNLSRLVQTPGAVDLSALESNRFAKLSMAKIKLP